MQLKPIWYFKKFPKGDLRLKNKDLKREALETRNESARGYIRKSSNKSRRYLRNPQQAEGGQEMK